MTVTLSKSQINPDPNKPFAISNKGFPYSSLPDHRRFEELVYSILRQEIHGGSWKDQFDDISLMQGVRERGRDCVLFFNSQSKGLVQCKHSIDSTERISRPECVREILKFVLHSTIDKSLISDKNSFTYFFAVSYGLSEPAQSLLDNFTDEISKESELDNWAVDIINSNKALGSIVYNNVAAQVRSTLSAIRVKKILPQDLDLLLSTPSNQNIIPLFFEIRSIIRTEDVGPIVQRELEKMKDIPVDRILESFKSASHHLTNYNDHFEGLPQSNIKRKETEDLYDWIISPIKQSSKPDQSELPIALLAGNAGVGKTVILKELFSKLLTVNIPVIGLKADRLYVKSIKELEEKTNLEDSLTNLLKKLKEKYDKVVVLIDQIDALSQSISTSNEYLDTFNQLVHKLCSKEGIRIIISCRIYDLNYDSELRFYKNQKIFQVNLLEMEQVKEVLKQLHANHTPTGSLLELLRTPHHLNVYCKIVKRDFDSTRIRSLNDLYGYLWRQNIIQTNSNRVSSDRCKKLLYGISEKMYQEQKIVVNINPHFEDYYQEIEYLKSNGLLLSSHDELQFFHQTFYDYSFSRAFVESQKKVADYIIENHQSLHIRPSLKMIISFLRTYDHKLYIEAYNEILFSKKGLNRLRKLFLRGLLFQSIVSDSIQNVISLSEETLRSQSRLQKLKQNLVEPEYRFHIKHLLMDSLGFESEITNEESILVTKILSDKEYRHIFIDSVKSGAWLNFLIRCGHLNLLLPRKGKVDKIVESYFGSSNYLNRCVRYLFKYDTTLKVREFKIDLLFRLLVTHLPKERLSVVRCLNELPDFENKGEFVARILNFLETWDLPIAFELFGKYKQEIENDKHAYYKIVEDVANFDIKWAIEIYRVRALKKISTITHYPSKSEFEYDDEKLIKKLFNINPESAFEFTLDLVETICEMTSSQLDIEDNIVFDLAFSMFDYGISRNSHGHEGIYYILVENTINLSKEKSRIFADFVAAKLDSRFDTIIKLLIHGLNANPQHNFSESFSLIKNLNNLGIFQHEGKLQFMVRRLIYSCYPWFTEPQKIFLQKLILNLRHPKELQIHIDNGRKYHTLINYGSRKLLYLQAIPQSYINSLPGLKKTYQELTRKFPTTKDKDVYKTTAGVVGPPLEQGAYKKMNLAHWENSFKKYNSKFVRDFRSLKGSKTEHARAFENEVTKRPNYFFPLIEKLIDDRSIESDYVLNGLRGLQSGGYNPSELKKLFKRIIKHDLKDRDTIQLIWLTDYFFNTNTIDPEIIHFLCYEAINNPNPEEDKESNDNLTLAVNTVRGAAAYRIPRLFQSVELKDLIFDTLNKVAKDKIISVRVSMISELAYLINLDSNKTLQVFLEVTKDSNPRVMKQSLWTANYLDENHFGEMKQFFENALLIESMRSEITALLTLAWLNEKKGSYSFLKRALNHPIKSFDKVVEVSLHHILNPKEGVRKRATILFHRFLSADDQAISNAYSHGFLYFSSEDFLKLFPLLVAYSKSKVVSRSPNYFFDYLLKCAKKYPKQCIELLSYFNKYEKPNITERGYYDDEPIKVLLGAYNSLKNSDELDSKNLEKSMSLFDKMLLDDRFRRTAQRALVAVDS